MAKAQSITAAALAQYLVLQKRRERLSRELDGIKRRMAPLGDLLRDQLVDSGKQSMKRQGYLIILIDGNPIVSWKDEYIAEHGEQAAEKIVAAAPINQWVKIKPL